MLRLEELGETPSVLDWLAAQIASVKLKQVERA
jgi:hypothetical protein